MLGDEVIQASLITKLKLFPSATGTFTNSAEIRELEWQGDDFSYPNVRLDLEDNRYYYDEQEKCQLQEVEWSVYVFSEHRSSKQCSQIKTEIINFLVGQGWTNIPHNIKFARARLLDNVPAIRVDERIWRSQVRFVSRVQGNL